MRFLISLGRSLHTREVAGSKPAAPIFPMAAGAGFFTPLALRARSKPAAPMHHEILGAMSQENVDVMRACVAAFNRGDLDAALKDFDPHVVIRLDPNWPENRPRLGADAARSFFNDLTAMVGTGQTIIEET